MDSDTSSSRLTPAQKKKQQKEKILKRIKYQSTQTANNSKEHQNVSQNSLKRNRSDINEITSNKSLKTSEKGDNIVLLMIIDSSSLSPKSSEEITTQQTKFTVHSIKTTWKVPSVIAKKKPESFNALRQEMNVTVTGNNIPPIIPRFSQMHLPEFVLNELKNRDINKPTSIQMQCLPAIFMGRDVIGIASHDKGKSLIGILSVFLFALEEEMKLPVTYDEGPIGIILSSSKDNAIHIYEKLKKWNHLLEESDLPHLRIVLCIGGESYSDQVKKMREGCHIIVATPGRFNDHLRKGSASLNICKIICLDDGEKLLGEDTEDEVKTILDSFHHPKQTILFSTSFPKSFIGFARDHLDNPIIVNAGEREIKRVDIEHNVQTVYDNERSVFLVKNCLNLTPPPVIIFTHVPKHIDEIEEYLLLKGLDAGSITHQMSCNEGKKVVNDLKEKKIDILIVPDYLKYSIHFPPVNHVINYDIPSDFSIFLKRLNSVKENGIATTFVSANTPEIALRELKYFLLKTKQQIPECMKSLKKEKEIVVEKGDSCLWCGRKGHSILNCPKL